MGNPLRWWTYLILLTVLAGGLSGCGLFSRRQAVEPDLIGSLPEEWQVVDERDPWQPVNIDGDPDGEFLLLYTYDNSTLEASDGPVGAVLYDLQESSEFATGQPPVPIPLQPSGAYIPYRIQPNYWSAASQGFVAGPGQGESVTLTPLVRNPVTEAGADELVLRADNHVTIIWWRNPFDGYGVAHLYAPADFRDINGGDWNTWSETPVVIQGLRGLYPLDGPPGASNGAADVELAALWRSLLCREVLFTRTDMPDSGTSTLGGSYHRSDIRYEATDQGIKFCRQAPAVPFYPEAVVLKYLLDPSVRDELVDPGVLGDGETDDQQSALRSAIISDTIAFHPDQEEKIDALVARAAVDYPEVYRSAQSTQGVRTQRLLTNVCVEFVNDAQGSRRLVYLTLVHIPPQREDGADGSVHTSDRMKIIDAVRADDFGGGCADIVARSAFESR